MDLKLIGQVVHYLSKDDYTEDSTQEEFTRKTWPAIILDIREIEDAPTQYLLQVLRPRANFWPWSTAGFNPGQWTYPPKDDGSLAEAVARSKSTRRPDQLPRP